MSEQEENEGEDNKIGEIKEAAATHSQAVVSALIRALFVFVIEFIVHPLLHGLEEYVTHEQFPLYAYRVVEYAGMLSVFLFVDSRLWQHCLDTYVDTRLDSRKSLQRLAPPTRNNAQVQSVEEGGHNHGSDKD